MSCSEDGRGEEEEILVVLGQGWWRGMRMYITEYLRDISEAPASLAPAPASDPSGASLCQRIMTKPTSSKYINFFAKV